jgi:prepilin-type N-terminal cleavage/methylation domain-containing protein
VTRRAAGLTLLELLVATALLAVFFASVYSLVSSTISIRDAIEDEATPYAVGPAVMHLVTDDLRGLVVEPYKDNDVLKAEVERVGGDECTKMDFVTTTPSRRRVKVQNEWVKARINEVGYRVRKSETDEERRLLALYRREDVGVDEDPREGGKYYKLADRVKQFKVDWFSKDPIEPDGEDAKGEEEWDAKKEKQQPVPWACRVTLVLVGESADSEEQPPEYAFSTFVVFPNRHDKGEEQPKK